MYIYVKNILLFDVISSDPSCKEYVVFPSYNEDIFVFPFKLAVLCTEEEKPGFLHCKSEKVPL